MGLLLDHFLEDGITAGVMAIGAGIESPHHSALPVDEHAGRNAVNPVIFQNGAWRLRLSIRLAQIRFIAQRRWKSEDRGPSKKAS